MGRRRTSAPMALLLRSLNLGVFSLFMCWISSPSGAFLPTPGILGSFRRAPHTTSLLRMSGDDKGPQQGSTQIPPQFQQPPPKLSKAQEKMIQNILEKSKNSKKMKRVKFKSKAKAEANVFDLGMAENVTLGKYMTLPAEQWVTLDEKFISRLDSGEDDKEVEYRFTMPLKSMMQLPLTATCDVAVEVDQRKREVMLKATGARLRASTPEDGDGPTMPEGQQAPPKLPENMTASIEMADMQVSFETRLKWTDAPQGDKNGSLGLATNVQVEITLPPPLSFFPGFILRQAGGLVLRAVSGQMLPRFGELVAEDYRRWSRGEPRLGSAMSSNVSTVSAGSLQLAGLDGPNPYYTPPPGQPNPYAPPGPASASDAENKPPPKAES